jgi:hypothetical protein
MLVQLALMVRSADPVAKKSLEGSKAMERTQPKCPETTVSSSQGACQVGFTTDFAGLVVVMSRCSPDGASCEALDDEGSSEAERE